MPHSSILLQIHFHSFIQLLFPHWLHSLDEERDTLTKLELRSFTVKESAITYLFHIVCKKIADAHMRKYLCVGMHVHREEGAFGRVDSENTVPADS